MSKLYQVDQLLSILDLMMSIIQDELLAQGDSHNLSKINHSKIRSLIEILIMPTLFFIKTIQDEENDGGI